MNHNELRAAALVLLSALALSAQARPNGETPRPVGVVEQPCPANVPSPDPKEFYERILDPSARRELEPPDPTAQTAIHAAEEDRLHDDWASLCRYRAENAALRHSSGAPRVVFMGDAITELWKVAHPEFFVEGFIDRGVKGQTTGQMLVRFRQDVIALKPSVVHLLAATNDFAGNAGPTSAEAIRNNIISMVELALANDIRVVIGSVTPAGSFPWRPAVTDVAQHIVDFNEWLRRFAKERGLIYVDYHEALADERDAMKQTFSNDGVHPNRDGYAAMELLARHAIEQALASINEAGNKQPVPATTKNSKSAPH